MTIAQKSYEFPKIGGPDVIGKGGSVTKTLAPPTNKRVIEFLEVVGKSSFDELLTPQGQIEYGLFVLNLGVEIEQLKKMLDVCLIEGSGGINFDALDLRLSDEAIQDFFEQRAERFLKRQKF